MTTLKGLLGAAALVALAAPAVAAPVVGLAGDKTLVSFGTDAPVAGAMVEVQGVDRLLGIDLRPSTGKLTGVTSDYRIVEIDPATGATTELSKLDTELPTIDGAVIVDFNPAADKLRLMVGTTNHRVDPATGAVTVDTPLAYVAEDMHAGEAPNVVAAAYTNSFGKPEKTAMYDIDATIGALVQQTAPNDGTLAAIGKLGVDGEGYAFDIATDEAGTNTAWLVTGTTLHQVSIETGAASGATPIEGLTEPLRDLTVLTVQ